ncbi:MAG: hypothetical protein IT207_01905 [Fimbriimonadaceae bacterium]|nr:hypothetical protein [Fimbriimonadaceae bacterium]
MTCTLILAAVALAGSSERAQPARGRTAPAVLAAVVSASNQARPDLGRIGPETDWDKVAKTAQLHVSRDERLLVLWPSSLFGMAAERELVRGFVSLIEELRRSGKVPGSGLPGPLAAGAEDAVAMATPFNFEPPSSIADMDFSFGVHGWYRLTDGTKSVWLMADRPSDTDRLRAGACSVPRNPKSAPRDATPPRFEALPGIRVDLLWEEGREPGIREKVELASLATELFQIEVTQASDEIRAGYARFFRELDGASSQFQRDALTGDQKSVSDLPPDVQRTLHERLALGFERHGFGSLLDAEKFFSKASIGDRRARVSIEFSIETPKGKQGFSGEFSGPFTPRE